MIHQVVCAVKTPCTGISILLQRGLMFQILVQQSVQKSVVLSAIKYVAVLLRLRAYALGNLVTAFLTSIRLF